MRENYKRKETEYCGTEEQQKKVNGKLYHFVFLTLDKNLRKKSIELWQYG